MVDHARTEYAQQRGRFAAEGPDGAAANGSAAGKSYGELFGAAWGDSGFIYWLKAGVAFTLPLLLLGLIGLFIFIWSLVSK
jgi:hypothetical protein